MNEREKKLEVAIRLAIQNLKHDVKYGDRQYDRGPGNQPGVYETVIGCHENCVVCLLEKALKT